MAILRGDAALGVANEDGSSFFCDSHASVRRQATSRLYQTDLSFINILDMRDINDHRHLV